MSRVEDNQLKYEKALEYDIFVKEEYGFVKNEIKKAECIFDIGGHIGFFSKWCRKLSPNANIYYFEPIGEFYERGKDSLGNDNKIVFNNYGIASKSGKGMMLLNSEKTMQSSKYTSFLNPKGREVAVNFITLKDCLEQDNIDKIDVLKMDVEGMEFEILPSRGEFEWSKIDNLIVEVHILNDKMKSEWNQIFRKIKSVFGNVEVIDSGYRKEIFLVRANK